MTGSAASIRRHRRPRSVRGRRRAPRQEVSDEGDPLSGGELRCALAIGEELDLRDAGA